MHQGAMARSTRWAEHGLLAAGVRLTALALPVLSALGASALVSRLVAQPASWYGRGAWWAGMLAVSTLVLVLVDRQARRLLPLAVLLKISLAFPDRVPSRWGIAMRAGTVNQLRKRVAEAQQASDGSVVEAARRVLALVAALTAHDRRTRGHAERVGDC